MRPSTTRQQLPRQPAAASSAATPVLGSPPLRTLGSLGPLHLCTVATHADLTVPLLGGEGQLGRCLFGLPAWEFWVSSLSHLVGSRVAALPLVPPLPGGGLSLTHSPRREVVSDSSTRGVPTPRLLGVSSRWCCFASHTCPHERRRCFRSRTLRSFDVTLLQRGCNSRLNLVGLRPGKNTLWTLVGLNRQEIDLVLVGRGFCTEAIHARLQCARDQSS